MANAYDAQQSWSTRNGIPGPLMLQDTPAARESDASNSDTGQIRAGWSPPTPETNSSNGDNSGNRSSAGSGTGSSKLPHDFSTLGKEVTIATGVYYHLIPKMDIASKHLGSVGSGFWFPVVGDMPVDFSFTHQWDQADNLAKKMLGAAASNIGGDIGDLAFKQAQHLLGGGLYVSGCSVFNSSAPPTISVATKLFSIGGRNLIDIIEALRGDTHARLNGGQSKIGQGAAALGGAAAGGLDKAFGEGTTQNLLDKAKGTGVKAGSIDHPGWWDVEVVSHAGDGSAKIVAKMKDMICTGLKVTMYSPWIGIEPSYMELRVEFQHAYPGLTESMSFGG